MTCKFAIRRRRLARGILRGAGLLMNCYTTLPKTINTLLSAVSPTKASFRVERCIVRHALSRICTHEDERGDAVEIRPTY